MEFVPTDPVMRGNTFAQILRLPRRLEANILTAGTSYRWLSIERRLDNSLVLSLNNNSSSHHYTNGFVNVGEWNHLICSLTGTQAMVRMFLNGKQLEDVVLPDEFPLAVTLSDKSDKEREFTLTNYGHGGTFRGYVDNLRVYSRCMDAITALALMPEHAPGVPVRHDLTRWVTYGVVLLSLGGALLSVLKRKE